MLFRSSISSWTSSSRRLSISSPEFLSYIRWCLIWVVINASSLNFFRGNHWLLKFFIIILSHFTILKVILISYFFLLLLDSRFFLICIIMSIILFLIASLSSRASAIRVLILLLIISIFYILRTLRSIITFDLIISWSSSKLLIYIYNLKIILSFWTTDTIIFVRLHGLRVFRNTAAKFSRFI
jgi:hypothetical protein